jgi:3-oxoadipate enol-lactonase
VINIPIEKLNGIELYYEVHGRGEPIILIMGFGSQSTHWFEQVPVLSKKHQVIIFDNRGVGRSERPNSPYTMKQFVDDVIALLDFLKIDTANVCGISMGGMIALQLVLAHPNRVKRLILLSTTAYAPDVNSLLGFIEQGESLPLKTRAKASLQILFSSPFQKRILEDKTLWEDFLRRFTENPTTLQDYRNQGEAIRFHDVRDRLHEIKVPVLIMVGTNDLLLPAKNSRIIAKGIHQAELVVLKGPGHAINIEAAAEVNTKILEFLKT